MEILKRLKLLYLEIVRNCLSKKNESNEVGDCFNYLGLTVNFNGKFTKTLKIIASEGDKCTWLILSICNRLSLNTETKLHVFDTYVSSVLNYGCEVWGFHPVMILKRFI